MNDRPLLSMNPQPTSVAAANKIAPRIGTLRGQVLALLKHQPMTDDELGEAMGKPMNSVRPRRIELVRDGFVIDSGLRRASKQGNAAIVWKVDD